MNISMDNKSKVAIVIGASSGIGKGIAELLIKKGYNVGVTARREEMLAELTNKYPKKSIFKIIDNTDLDRLIENLDAFTKELGGKIDLIIHSSGWGKRNPNLEFDLEERGALLNVSSFTKISIWAYKLFERQGFGHYVGITSVAGLRGSRLAPIYPAAKSFQIKYLEGLRQKAKRSGKPIYITDVRPGFVDTDMGHGDGAFWIAPVNKVSNQIYKRAVLSKCSVVYVTKRWRVIGTLYRLIPSFILNRV